MRSFAKMTEGYKAEGYCLARAALSRTSCNEMKAALRGLKAGLTIPFSDQAWGYGNLLQLPPFSEIPRHPVIQGFCRAMLGEQFVFNHLLVNNKAAWIGPDVEWHQEVSNIETYAPGYSPTEDWQKFVQVYIALDDQDLENGCLKIIPRSHELGFLPHEDIVGSNLGHKRRVTCEAMSSAHRECGLLALPMEVGDVLFFCHLLVHSSASNNSPRGRKSVVLQARSNVADKNLEVFERATAHRKQFVINALSGMLQSLQAQSPYKTFL